MVTAILLNTLVHQPRRASLLSFPLTRGFGKSLPSVFARITFPPKSFLYYLRLLLFGAHFLLSYVCFGLSYSFSSFARWGGNWSCQWILLRRVRKRGSRVKGLIGVTTPLPLPNARSVFFLTSLAAISEDGTCFSLSFVSCYSFNFFPIAACLASKPYLPFAASTERLVWSIGYFLFWLVLTQILSIKRYKRRRSAAYALISFRCRNFSGIDWR